MKYSPHIDESVHASLMSANVAGSLRAVSPLAGSSRSMRCKCQSCGVMFEVLRTFVMITSSRSVYHDLRHKTLLVLVGDAGRYRKLCLR